MNRGDGKLAKAIEAFVSGGPNASFTVLKEAVNAVASQAVRRGEYVCRAIVQMQKALTICGDPEPALAVSEKACRE